MVCATRPLAVKELEIALAITPCEYKLKPNNIPNVSKLFLDYCTSLLELDEITQTIQCIHATAKEFLVGLSNPRIINVSEEHSYIASVCLTYLSYPERSFVERTVDTKAIPFEEPLPWFHILHPDFHSHLKKNIFLRYSASNWILHFAQTMSVKAVTPDFQRCLEAMNALLSSEANVMKWVEIFHFLYVVDVEMARTASDKLDKWITEYEDRRLPIDLKDSINRSKLELDLTGALSTFSFSFIGFPQVDILVDSASATCQTYLSELQLSLLGQSWPDPVAHLGYSSLRGLFRWRRLVKTELMPRKVLTSLPTSIILNS